MPINESILEFPAVTAPNADHCIPLARPGVNEKIRALDLLATSVITDVTVNIQAGEISDTDYTDLNDAVADIGASPATLVISTPNFSSGSDCTVPATLLLRFVGNGSISVVTGETVTIQSDGSDWPIRKIFNNALSGEGTVSFIGNNSVSVFNPAWWGTVGDWNGTTGTDDTAALQATIDAMQPRTAFVWPSRFRCKTTAPLRVWTMRELRFFSEANSGFYTDSNTGIDYRGPDGTAAVQFYNTFSSKWDGINISFNHDSNVAQGAIDSDQFPDATVIDGRAIVGSVNSDNTFKDFGAITENNGVDAFGVRMAYTSAINVERQICDHVQVIFNGSDYLDVNNLERGSAFKIGGGGGGANAKNMRFRDCDWTFATYGIESVGGQILVIDGEGQFATQSFKLTGAAALIVRFRPENSRQFLDGSGNITLISNEIPFGGWDTVRSVTDLVTNSTTTITSATANFTGADVGRQIIIAQIGAGGLTTTIASVTNSTTAILSTAAGWSASGNRANIGWPIVFLRGSSELTMWGNGYDSQANVMAVDADPAGQCRFIGGNNVWPTTAPDFNNFFGGGAVSLNHLGRMGMLIGGDALNGYGVGMKFGVPTTFAQLANVQFGDGSVAYCSDCTSGTSPATGGGTGALVVRQNGAWKAL